MDYKGQRVLITGASSGIGRALALEFARRGADLVITARSQGRLEELAREVAAAQQGDVRVVVADLERPGGAELLATEVDALGITIDHLVNNAGFGGARRFHQMDREHMLAMLRLNCEALTALTHHYLPGMLARQRGGVLQVASVVGFFPLPFMAEYAATKAYVVSFTRALREEMAGTGVRACVLCPGSVPSGFQARAGYELSGAEAGSALLPADVARIAVSGYSRNRAVIVPGLGNRLGAFVLSALPPATVAWIAARVMRSLGRV